MSERRRRVATWFSLLALGGCGGGEAPPRAVGQLESDRVELVAEFAETITERTVAEGETVTGGQAVVIQNPERAMARKAEAAAALDEARARLAELVRGPRREQIDAARAGVARARQELAQTEREHARAKDVFERDLAARQTLDEAETALGNARADLDLQLARLDELLSGTTLEELNQAEAVVAGAEAALAAARLDLRRHRVIAPTDGVIDSLPFESGEQPRVGQPVAILLTGTQPYALAWVPESIRASVRPGDSVRVHVDGLEEAISGRVRWIASDAAFTPYFALTERDRGHLTYPAKIDLGYSGGRLPDGVPVEVEFAQPGT